MPKGKVQRKSKAQTCHAALEKPVPYLDTGASSLSALNCARFKTCAKAGEIEIPPHPSLSPAGRGGG